MTSSEPTQTMTRRTIRRWDREYQGGLRRTPNLAPFRTRRAVLPTNRPTSRTTNCDRQSPARPAIGTKRHPRVGAPRAEIPANHTPSAGSSHGHGLAAQDPPLAVGRNRGSFHGFDQAFARNTRHDASNAVAGLAGCRRGGRRPSRRGCTGHAAGGLTSGPSADDGADSGTTSFGPTNAPVAEDDDSGPPGACGSGAMTSLEPFDATPVTASTPPPPISGGTL